MYKRQFVGLFVCITAVVLLIPKLTSAKQEQIPDVSGYTVTEAIKVLQDAGFIVSDEQREEASETVDAGRVTKTSPAAGAIRKEGTEIILYISLGDITVEIEDYVGQNSSEVKGRLEALNLQVDIEPKVLDEGEDPNDYEEGIIIDQSVEPGEKLSEGDRIILYVPKLENKYPNFVEDQYSISEVEEFAEDYGINLTIVYEQTDEYEPGTILKQSRAAGSIVVEGAKLTITVASEPNSDIDDPSTGEGLE